MKRRDLVERIVLVLAAVALLTAPSSLVAQSRKFDAFTLTKPLVGDTAPDFTLQTVDGDTFRLSDACARQPVVIEFGSYT